MVKAKFSMNYRAIQARIRRLPKILTDRLEGYAKRDAVGVVREFQQGLEERSLRLKPLEPSTVQRKAALGLEHPDHPLWGLGLEERRSYVNMMEVKRVGKAWIVRPKNRFHHGKRKPGDPGERKIRLRDLFDVHEYGATVIGAFGHKGQVVRVPARPAFRYAYRRYMAGRASRDPAGEVKQAIVRYVQTGDRKALARIEAKEQEAQARIDEAGD